MSEPNVDPNPDPTDDAAVGPSVDPVLGRYEPHSPDFASEAAVRTEMSRVFGVCGDCRRCIDLCDSFPTLFDLLDSLDDGDPGRLTPEQQDRVVAGCHHCKMCVVGCPYSPGRHDDAVHVPRLMLRAEAMHTAAGHRRGRHRLHSRVAGRVDRIGRVATSMPSVSNRLVRAPADSITRRVVRLFTGLSARRAIPRVASQRYSSFFGRRPKIRLRKRQAAVTILPTCLVEYGQTTLGTDIVRVYERNGIECSVSGVGCCGAPSLHTGDLAGFRRAAHRNVRALAAAVRRGTDIVVAQPTCSYVLRNETPEHVDESLRADAELVAEHVYDPAGYLMSLHRTDTYVLDTDFASSTPRKITYHAPSHLRAQSGANASRDLLRLTGARVTVVARNSGVAGPWGRAARHDDQADRLGDRLAERIQSASGQIIAGASLLANEVIHERTGDRPVHPIQVIARAYGIPSPG